MACSLYVGLRLCVSLRRAEDTTKPEGVDSTPPEERFRRGSGLIETLSRTVVQAFAWTYGRRALRIPAAARISARETSPVTISASR
jgi:hypothetical protein